MDEKLIAPCGINCSLCISYQFMKKDLKKEGFRRTYCPGCIPKGENCTHMGHKCELLGKGIFRFCFECKDFPCKDLKALDKRYRSKYHLSLIENLRHIEAYGIEQYLEKEEEKWRCPECGEMICCHNGLCLNCNLETLQQNKKYRWGKSE